jgi:hypothetical protein
MQRQCVVNNTLYYLVVEANNTKRIMHNLYKIPVQQLVDFTIRIYLGMNSFLKFKFRWSNPNAKTIAGLHGIEDLIPWHIKTHF